ncbi:MAG: hypothetical protein E7016_03920 [Alphaproteobacteria bacterium]|nr:hypothetical protein [Alphaproteobacteria bacterium]
MAKKRKEMIDIDEALINNLDISNQKLEENDTQEDEFEKLLNSFLSTEDDSVPDVPVQENAVDDEVPEPNLHNNIRAEISELSLGSDELELAQAYANFTDAISAIAIMHEVVVPEFYFKPEMMVPNYKPSVGKKIVSDASMCWDVMLQAFPERLANLNPMSSDEEFLNFAEGLSDQNLQLAIISYVEILIDIENCEISYEEKRLKAQRKRIERELYEEYQRRRERKLKFAQEIKKRNFPVDAERLINNYFKTSAKDEKGAYEALIKNPAVYAPIEINKIKPRFFGLLKVTPKDGIRENHRLGEFLKHLKV